MKKRIQPNWKDFRNILIEEMGPFRSFKISIRTNLKTIIKFELIYEDFIEPPKIESIKLYIEEKRFSDDIIMENVINYLTNFIKLTIPTKDCIIRCHIIKLIRQKISENYNLFYFDHLLKSKLTNYINNLDELDKQLIKIK